MNYKDKIRNGGTINFYELDEVKNISKKYHNPNIHIHNIKIPFRMIVVGASGSGKTNITLNLITQFTNTFNHISIFTQNADEELYNYLRKKISHDSLSIYEGIEALNEINIDKHFKGQNLVIFDDLALTKNQDKISEFYIRGRKIANGISMVYLSQKYALIPPEIRSNINYCILKKIASERDLSYILKESSLGMDKEGLFNMYKYCNNGKLEDFLLIDIGANDINKMFRKGFIEYLNPDEF